MTARWRSYAYKLTLIEREMEESKNNSKNFFLLFL